jgi:REP element-mobilizing transposase RayT
MEPMAYISPQAIAGKNHAGLFKSITAREIFTRKHSNAFGSEFWTDGYYVATVRGGLTGKWSRDTF